MSEEELGGINNILYYGHCLSFWNAIEFYSQSLNVDWDLYFSGIHDFAWKSNNTKFTKEAQSFTKLNWISFEGFLLFSHSLFLLVSVG